MSKATLQQIAIMYLNRIKRDNLKVLNFFPLKRTGSISNNMRLLVLEKLTVNNCHMAKDKREKLEIATQAALDAGYTIREVE